MKPESLEVLTVFSHPARVELMVHLGKRPITIDQLTEKVALERAAVNAHVQRLRNADLIKQTSGGRPVYYELDKKILRNAIEDFARAAGVELSTPGRKPAARAKKTSNRSRIKPARKRSK